MVFLFSWAYENYNHHSFNALRFQNALHQKSKDAERFVNSFTEKLRLGEEWYAVDSTESDKPKGVDVLVYRNDSLCAWTNEVLPYQKEEISILSRRVVKLSNTWYIVKRVPFNEFDVFTLVSVKTEYPYNNEFLNDEYAISLPLVLCHEISTYKDVKGVKLYDADGNYLFTARECSKSNPIYANWAVLFIFISLLLYVQVLIFAIKSQNSPLRVRVVFFMGVVVSSILYYFHAKYFFPSIAFETELFSPIYFGASDLFPNMGSMLIFALLVYAKSYVYYKFVGLPSFIVQLPKKRFTCAIVVISAIISIYASWYVLNKIVALLVSNSASAPILFKITDIGVLDIVRLFIISLLWLSAILLLEKSIKVFLEQLSKKRITWLILVSMSLMVLFSFSTFYILGIVIFLIISLMLVWVTRRKSYHAYNTFIWFVSVFALYAVITFYYYNAQSEKEARKLLIENLSFRLMQEEDPLSELLLKESENAIANDTIIKKEVSKVKINVDKLERYIKRSYLQGYLNRYDVQVVPCWPEGDVHIEDQDRTLGCYDYFDELLLNNGTQVMGSRHFYFLESSSGVETYFGVFKWFENDLQKETRLYIELVAKPYFEGPGYPELLLSERETQLRAPLEGYSYGKYIDGVLVKQSGEFEYPINHNRIVNGDHNFNTYLYEGYSHMTYHPEEGVCVILSLPKVGLSMILVAYSIFFISFFIFGAFLMLITRIKRDRLMYIFSVQERIQIAFIGLMLVLLMVIAGGSVWQTIRRFEIKNNQMLSEKTRSVLMELEHKVGYVDEIKPEMEEYLSSLLKKFSSVFYTDINMYDASGRLLASSRPELFNKGLLGHLMNSKGFIELSQKGEREYIHRESIGQLKYLSAYVPLYNMNNELLAYLNMPYFVGTSELREEVSSLVMAIVNFYLIFLIVVIGLTVVVSRRITHPLLVVQNKLSELRLGGRNEKIEYKGNDEIGQLVKEYNRMVDELSESAEKLARSERESAWREMARQIAHEIKNPLTPMKLSIQYLEMAQKNKDADFEQKLKRVSNTLIDQIDKLSSIASEFSNFAKMPIAKRKKVNVLEVLARCVGLFDKSKNVDISVNPNGIESYFIYADAEQLISVFNNLLQNAIQSIPDKKEGVIQVMAVENVNSILIKVKDNGRGIPAEAQEKLFTPNFTTKTSGMGLGLAIVKNIVKNTNGKIWFETQENEGTTFYVEFPAYDL